MPDTRTLSAQEWQLLVHAAYGKAMLQAHSLELTLRTLLICNATTSPECKAASELTIAKVKRMPMGQLIDDFADIFSPSDDLIEELDNSLYFRNDLAHRISDQITSASVSSNWEEVVIKDLEETCGYFIDAQRLLKPHTNEMRIKLGVTETTLLEMMYKIYPGVIRRA